jgi:hypothetical protein
MCLSVRFSQGRFELWSEVGIRSPWRLGEKPGAHGLLEDPGAVCRNCNSGADLRILAAGLKILTALGEEPRMCRIASEG